MRYKIFNSLRPFLCGLIVIFAAVNAHAQFNASVQGSVTDPTGAVIPSATVTLLNKETAKTQQVTASDEGFYRFTGLAPGQYSISVEQSGFKKSVLDVTVSA